MPDMASFNERQLDAIKEVGNIGTGNAATATSAEQDGLGNIINSTYATKAELPKLAENVPAFKFTLTGGVLTISNGNKSYQFVGTAV